MQTLLSQRTVSNEAKNVVFTKQKQRLAFTINWSYDKKCSRFIRKLFWIHRENVLAKKIVARKMLSRSMFQALYKKKKFHPSKKKVSFSYLQRSNKSYYDSNNNFINQC